MVLYDIQCNQCLATKEVFCDSQDIDSFSTECPRCGGLMTVAWLPNNRKPFPAFVTPHLKGYNGGAPMEINSLHQIRQLEKKYQDRELRWEPGNYDSHYGEE